MSILQIKTGANIGEIAQGALSPQSPFLISNLSSSFFHSKTHLEPQETIKIDLGEKSAKACAKFLEKHIENNSGKGFKIWQESNIPKGKGLSSSSADILGVLSILNNYYHSPFPQADLYKMAAEVDPTDACLSPALTVFNQHRGEIVSTLKNMPFTLIYFDSEPETIVDTIKFTKNKIYTHQDYRFFKQMLQNLTSASVSSDITNFLFWTTQSAVYNQRFLPKKHFNKLLSYALSKELGLFVAHSGTIMGLVIPGNNPDSWLVSQSEDFIRSNWGSEIYIEKPTN
jgi:L-threonine kinase